jgi:hypothetical protein
MPLPRPLTFCALLLLSPFSALALDDFPSDFPPALKFKETLAGQNDPVAQDVKLVNEMTVSGSLSMQGVDTGAYNASTPYDVELGDLTLSGTLGNDPAYTAGKTSITVPIKDWDYETGALVQVGTVSLSWNSAALTVSVYFKAESDDMTAIAGWYADSYDGPGSIDNSDATATVRLGGNESDFDMVFYEGGNTGTEGAVFNYFDPGWGWDTYELDLPDVIVRGLIDSKPPLKPVVSFPANKQVVFNQNITITGSAQDNEANTNVYSLSMPSPSGIDEVDVQVNGGDWQEAVLVGENWQLGNVHLQTGANTINIQSFDDVGLPSPVLTQTFIYDPSHYPLTVEVIGSGTAVVQSDSGVTADITTSGTLPIYDGDQTTLQALPASALYEFKGWTIKTGTTPLSTTVTTDKSNPLHFTMIPGTTVQANFVPSRFVQTAGIYAGGFLNSGTGGTWGEGGNITLTAGVFGALSGKIYIGGKSYSFKGNFSLGGDFDATLGSSVAHLHLHVDTNSFAGAIAGTLSIGGDTITFSLAQNQWNKKTKPTAYAGYYTVVLPPENPAAPNTPEGDGFATFKIDTGGGVKGTLCLPDGGKLSFGSYVSDKGGISVAGVIKTKAAAVSGTMTFKDVPGVSDLDGTLTWLKSAGQNPKDTLYPAPFVTHLPAIGSKYDALTVAPALFNSGTTSAAVVNDCPVVSGTASNTVTLLAGGKTTVTSSTPAGNGLKLTFKLSTGLFGGSFVDANGTTQKFSGAFLQKQAKGGGYFLGKDALGNGFSGCSSVDASTP